MRGAQPRVFFELNEIIWVWPMMMIHDLRLKKPSPVHFPVLAEVGYEPCENQKKNTTLEYHSACQQIAWCQFAWPFIWCRAGINLSGPLFLHVGANHGPYEVRKNSVTSKYHPAYQQSV